jgi:hypothetical protein
VGIETSYNVQLQLRNNLLTPTQVRALWEVGNFAALVYPAVPQSHLHHSHWSHYKGVVLKVPQFF